VRDDIVQGAGAPYDPPMRRGARLVGSLMVVACAVAACSDDATDVDSAQCVASGQARVCGDVVDGALAITSEGLRPGSTVRINVEGAGPAEWTVSDDGTIENDPGSLGFLSVTGTFGTITVDATADDGTAINGTITLD
jgi:hypothetical protein